MNGVRCAVDNRSVANGSGAVAIPVRIDAVMRWASNSVCRQGLREKRAAPFRISSAFTTGSQQCVPVTSEETMSDGDRYVDTPSSATGGWSTDGGQAGPDNRRGPLVNAPRGFGAGAARQPP